MEEPNIINIAVVRGVCVANCKHCPVGQLTPEQRIARFGKGFISLNAFKDICDQTLEFNNKPTIRVHGVGEPILWKKLRVGLAYAKENGLNTWVFTMGLGQKRYQFIETIKHAGIVEFSINSYEERDYMETKGLDSTCFHEVKKRISLLSKIKDRPRLLISRVQTNDEKADKAFLDFWQSTNLADDVFIRSFHDYNQKISDEGGLLGNNSKDCLVPNSRMNIDGVLGVAVRCFNELFDCVTSVRKIAVHKILQDMSLKEIWESKTMNDWRENIFAYPSCNNCRSCQPKDSDSSEKQIGC
ncbi:MAG: hypothetical protein ACOCQ4_01665 [bacterium]